MPNTIAEQDNTYVSPIKRPIYPMPLSLEPYNPFNDSTMPKDVIIFERDIAPGFYDGLNTLKQWYGAKLVHRELLGKDLAKGVSKEPLHKKLPRKIQETVKDIQEANKKIMKEYEENKKKFRVPKAKGITPFDLIELQLKTQDPSIHNLNVPEEELSI